MVSVEKVTRVPFCPSNRLVSGAGDIKLTKDGNVLLHEMVSGQRRPGSPKDVGFVGRSVMFTRDVGGYRILIG